MNKVTKLLLLVLKQCKLSLEQDPWGNYHVRNVNLSFMFMPFYTARLRLCFSRHEQVSIVIANHDIHKLLKLKCQDIDHDV